MPCAAAPWVWPCRIIGLTASPTSSTPDQPHELHHAGLGIDLDLADMRARREGADRDGVVADAVELALQIVGQVVARRRRLGDLEDADAPVGALDGEDALRRTRYRPGSPRADARRSSCLSR